MKTRSLILLIYFNLFYVLNSALEWPGAVDRTLNSSDQELTRWTKHNPKSLIPLISGQ